MFVSSIEMSHFALEYLRKTQEIQSTQNRELKQDPHVWQLLDKEVSDSLRSLRALGCGILLMVVVMFSKVTYGQ